jgi:pimeloyl-ACP methyl ester carboxylesterase
MVNIEKKPLLQSEHSQNEVFHHVGEKPSDREKTALWAYNFFSVVVFPVGFSRLTYAGLHWVAGKMIVPSQFIGVDKSLRKRFCSALGAKEISIITEDGVKLEAMRLEGKKAHKNGPTVILTNPNGMLMDDMGEKASWYQSQGFNVVLFNYRGTGASSGRMSRDGLLKDGEAVYAYVKSLTSEDKKIVLDGHSLGGAVAAHVAAKNPGCHVLSDRSFSTLSLTIDKLIVRGLGSLAKGLSWELDSASCWSKITGKRWIVHAPDDGIIVKHAGLFHHLGADSEHYDLVIELDRKKIVKEFFFAGEYNLGMYAHNIPLPQSIRIQLIEEMKEATGLGK